MSFIEFQFRHGPAADWTSANPILLLAEQGVESDTGKYKIGDGVTAWNSLLYNGLGSSGYSGFSGAGFSGFSGFSGRSGYSGYSGSGISGYSGFCGTGTSGFSGFSGAGTSGFSGFSSTAPGISGFSGFSGAGTSGFSGFSGPGSSGFSGYSGYSGSSGYSGFSGSGISGFSGFSGAGLSGFSGFSGPAASGFSGFSGLSGYSAYSGFCGLSGYSGFSGQSGYSGFSGQSGYSGFSGASGYSGFSGKSGYSGYSGPQLLVFSEQTDTDYTLVAGDANTGVKMTSAAAHNLTIPLNATVPFAIGTQIPIEQGGAGVVTIVPTGGVTLQGPTTTSGQYSVGVLIKQATDTWLSASGISGYSGFSGASGISGFSGFSGKSGYSGYSGFSGQSGYSGYSGFSSLSGFSGFSSLSGFSGFSSLSGFSGFSGPSGYSGYSAFSGFSGTTVLYGVTAGQALTSTSLVDITGLTFSLTTGTWIFDSWIYGQVTSGTAGVQMGINMSANFTSADFLVTGQGATATAQVAPVRGTANNTAVSPVLLAAATTEGWIHVFGQVVVGGAGTFSIRALKVTSQTFTVRAGGFCRVKQTS